MQLNLTHNGKIYLDVLNNFQVILLSLQLLLDLFISINNDCQHHIDQDPTDGHSEQEEHQRGNTIRLLSILCVFLDEF